ncbi:hypothetical protein HWI79_643 [Cryptosporidium felis]|nr:hypothetical protein HWI79_643 [Cryptosporidium felis]
MKGICLKKVFRNISQDGIEYKLATSAILLDFGELESEFSENKGNSGARDELKYILKMVMTSFHPVELTTELGGPWEGHFFWSLIKDRIQVRREMVASDGSVSIMNFLDYICNEAPERGLSLSLVKYCDYMEQNSHPSTSQKVVRESGGEKDYLLKLENANFEDDFFFHLKSTYSIRGKPLIRDEVNVVRCLSDMLNLIKIENSHLQENLLSLVKLNNEKVGAFKTEEQVTVNSQTASSLKQDNNDNYHGRDNIINYDIQFQNSSSQVTNGVSQMASPNTRGTLELSELRASTSRASNFHRSDFSNVEVNEGLILVREGVEKQSGPAESGFFPNTDSMFNQLKTYRFIKESGPRNDGVRGYASPNFIGETYFSSNNNNSPRRSSRLRSAIEAIRRTQNELLSDQIYHSDEEHQRLNITNFRKSNTGRPIKPKINLPSRSNHQRNTKNTELLEDEIGRNSILSREQLMNKLSNTKDISERINILKNMIRKTKKGPFYLE